MWISVEDDPYNSKNHHLIVESDDGRVYRSKPYRSLPDIDNLASIVDRTGWVSNRSFTETDQYGFYNIKK